MLRSIRHPKKIQRSLLRKVNGCAFSPNDTPSPSPLQERGLSIYTTEYPGTSTVIRRNVAGIVVMFDVELMF